MTTVGRIVPWIVLAPAVAVALALAFAVAGCGGPTPSQAPEARPKAQETVFDDVVDKKREIPQAVESAQTQRFEEQRRQMDAAETGAPAK
jgi:hypothetical protein